MKANNFGKKILADFYLDPQYTNINHGSYGACPRIVMQEKNRIEQLMEFNPEKFLRYNVEGMIAQTRSVVAKKIKCNTNNVFIIQNATDGINSLVKSLNWEKGDIIALPNTAYSCVKKTVEYLIEKFGVTVLPINFTIEDFQSPHAIQLKVQDTINSYPKKIKLVILDHIISVPAVVCPIEGLSVFLKKKNILLFVDGAHAVCQQNISMQQIEPDAYFSNFHKWGYSPKAAAFLYVSDNLLTKIHPALTGIFKGQGISRQFFWTGTRDYSSYLSVPKGLEYFSSFGQNAVQLYCKNLSIEAGKKMAEIWGTKLLTEDDRLICNMNNVYSPSNDIDQCVNIGKKMLELYNCFPVFFKFEDKVLCRISAQIYNQLSDFQNAAKWFLALKAQNSKK